MDSHDELGFWDKERERERSFKALLGSGYVVAQVTSGTNLETALFFCLL